MTEVIKEAALWSYHPHETSLARWDPRRHVRASRLHSKTGCAGASAQAEHAAFSWNLRSKRQTSAAGRRPTRADRSRSLFMRSPCAESRDEPPLLARPHLARLGRGRVRMSPLWVPYVPDSMDNGPGRDRQDTRLPRAAQRRTRAASSPTGRGSLHGNPGSL